MTDAYRAANIAHRQATEGLHKVLEQPDSIAATTSTTSGAWYVYIKGDEGILRQLASSAVGSDPAVIEEDGLFRLGGRHLRRLDGGA